jgi:hypothetical protein
MGWMGWMGWMEWMNGWGRKEEWQFICDGMDG